MGEELLATIDYSKRLDIDLEFKKDDTFLSLDDEPIAKLREKNREWVQVKVSQ